MADGLRLSSSQTTKSELELSASAGQQESGTWTPPPTLFETLWALTSWYGDRPFLGTRTRGPGGQLGAYQWSSYEQVWHLASLLGAGLVHLQFIVPGEFLSLCSPNRSEWILGDFACVMYRFVAVPLVVTLDEETLAFVINQAEVRCVIASSDMAQKLLAVAPQCPLLRGIVIMNDEPGVPGYNAAAPMKASGGLDGSDERDEAMVLFLQHLKSQAPAGFLIYSFAEVLEAGVDAFPGEYPGKERKPEDLFSLIYTSGSTGMPKGAMMSDRRWNHFVTKGYLMPQPCRILSFAPLGHVSERQLYWLVAFYGGMYGFYNGDMAFLTSDFQALNPTYLSAPPRIFNAVYTEYKEAVDRQVALRGKSERWKIELEVLDQFRGVFGNALQFLVTGSAPTSDTVKQFLRQCFCVPLYDGYGTTEAGGIATDGVISPDVDVQLLDVPDLGYFSTDKPYPRGEICVHTDTMIEGYFKNEAKTADSFVEINGKRYFRTGDIGFRRLGHFVEIIDRVKNVFKLASGEFVAPAKSEAVLEKSSFVDQICIVGAPAKFPEKVVAIVVPCLEVCSRLLFKEKEEERTTVSLSELVAQHSTELEMILLTDFGRIANRAQLLSYECPSRIIFSPFHFTSGNDLLTPSFKLKRAPIEKHFSAEISAIATAPPLNPHGEAVTESKLRTLLEEVLSSGGRTEKPQLDQSFLLQGGDSLSAVRLVSKIKAEFGQDVPVSFLLSNPTMDELAQVISGEVSASGATQFHQKQRIELPKLVREDIASASLSLGPLKKSADPSGGKVTPLEDAQCVMLTGVTGFLGSFLLEQILLRVPKALVVCIVRGASDMEARNRLEENLIHQRRILLSSWDRVQVIAGDISDGLCGFGNMKRFNQFSQKVDAVFHSAAAVNWMLSYEAIRSANVLPCLDLVRFCTTGRLKQLFHISTASCCPQRPIEGGYEIYDGFQDEDYAAAALGPYALSKWAAEMIFKACASEMEVVLFRPANIMADSRSEAISFGSSNTTDYPDRYLHSCAMLGMAIDEPAVLNFTPVDYCARAILDVSLAQRKPLPQSGTPILLTNNESPTYHDICEAFMSVRKTIKPVSYREFRRNLLGFHEPERLQLYGLIPLFTVEPWIYSGDMKGDCSNVLAYSDKCPATTLDHLRGWIQFLDAKFLPDQPRCPFCKQGEADLSMVQCSRCAAWVHCGCDNLTLPLYQALNEPSRASELYHCCDCRKKHGLEAFSSADLLAIWNQGKE